MSLSAAPSKTVRGAPCSDFHSSNRNNELWMKMKLDRADLPAPQTSHNHQILRLLMTLGMTISFLGTVGLPSALAIGADSDPAEDL
jgi:hypothetical protein